MTTSIFGRAIGAFTAFLLMLGLMAATAGPAAADDDLATLQGNVWLSGRFYIADIGVRAYRSTGNPSNPWVLEATAHTEGGDLGPACEDTCIGGYTLKVPAGTYRLTFNEFDEGTKEWDVWKPTDWVDPWDDTPATREVFAGPDVNYMGVTDLEYRGGTISGEVIDQCGDYVYDAAIETWKASGATEPSLTEQSGLHGQIATHGLGSPSKVRVVSPEPTHHSVWIGGGTSYASAQPIVFDSDNDSPNHTVVVERRVFNEPAEGQPNPSFFTHVRDPENNPIVGVPVQLYRLTSDLENPSWTLEQTVKSDSQGKVLTGTLPVGTYKMIVNGGDSLPSWTTLEPTNLFCMIAGRDTGLPVSKLVPRGPIDFKARTRISGTSQVGSTLNAIVTTSHDNVDGFVRTYRWSRTKGRTTTLIPGATSSAYALTAADMGSQLSVRVTVTPPASFPDVQADSSSSLPTAIVRSQTHVTASAKAIGGRKFTVNVTVKVDGVTNPKGQVYVSWVQLKQQGSYLVPTGKWISKLVTYTNGKASYTVTASKTGYWAWEAYHPDTSTTISSSADGYLKVR